MKSLAEIRAVLHGHAHELAGRFGIVNLAVFGSVARGEATAGSDIDILADFNRPVSLFEVAGAENYLIDLLGADVEVIPRRSVRAELRDQILNEAIAV